MKLTEEKWTSCSVHEVTLSFLRSEWIKWPTVATYWDRRLIEEPVSMDSGAINLRALMLWAIRSALIGQVPQDTKWFKVEHLRKAHLDELLAINHIGFTSATDRNELRKVALRMPNEIWRGAPPSGEWSPILWGHDRGSPFTILEANHRMTALAQPDLGFDFEIPAYVGLSQERCIWHLPDH
jgi:hypothetical protein